MGRKDYAVHRWLGAIVGVQLFLWSLGGFMFSIHDINWVRGERGRSRAPTATVDLAQVVLTPADAASRLGSGVHPERVTLRPFLGAPVYEIHHAGGTGLVDARTGAVRSPIDAETAAAIARADRAAAVGVSQIRSIVSDPPTEYRGGALPAWRVELDDEDNTHIYVAKSSGRITARRNDAWRRFDFFWMLHTMDYRGRDDFNHWLLVGFSLLGLGTVTSGGLLWAGRVIRRVRRRRRARASGTG